MKPFDLEKLIVFAIGSTLSTAGAVESDGPTLLLAHCENSMNSTTGPSPDLVTGVSFEAGVQSKGVYISDSGSLRYAPNGGAINPLSGTFEAWVKPRWAGSDSTTRTFLSLGGYGGMLIAKDGANNLRLIVNRYAAAGKPELGVAVNVSSWLANEWHHIAFTWDSTALNLYVDGTLRSHAAVSSVLPQVANQSLYLGIDGSGSPANAVLDEIRISNRARTADEIARSFVTDLPGVTGLSCSMSQWQGWPTWSLVPKLQATSALGVISVPSAALQWTSSRPDVAAVDALGRIQALAAGTSTLTAALNGSQTTVSVTVNPPIKQPEELPIDPGLATPMAGALYDMPVAVISYLPTLNGTSLDAAEAGDSSTIAAKKSYIATLNARTKFMLEEGSRYHGYKDSQARPSLGYRVVKNIVVYEPLPPLEHGAASAVQPDYRQILTRWGAEDLVKKLGVKEFWVWGYHTAKIYPVESNMSSPVTGDISNSYRLDDLPVFDRTYVLYNYNYTRSQAEAVHNHGHQLEAILSYVNWRQDGNTVLWWDKFCGRNADGSFQKGRCGNTHCPPNTASDYDYLNTTTVLSDCMDWTPDKTKQLTQVNASTWGQIPYAFPSRQSMGQVTESSYYVFWMQNIPGRGNGVRYGTSRAIRNWWEFTADWDKAIRNGDGLHKEPEVAIFVRPPSAPGAPVIWNLAGDAGFDWELQSSTDLHTWIVMQSLPSFGGELSLSEAPDPGGRKFLRLMRKP